MRDLIRRDQERHEKVAALQRLVTEGLDSGISTETMADIAASVRAASREGHGL